MFKGGAKEALVDDVDKAYVDNHNNTEDLKSKLFDVERIIKGLEDVS